MSDIIKLIDYCDINFNTQWGPSMAFFEIPQAGGEPVRAIYVTYRGRGNDRAELMDWMMDKVLVPLKEAGAHYLYWRLTDRFELESNEEGEWSLRTRIAALDKDLKSVTLPNVAIEGTPSQVVSS